MSRRAVAYLAAALAIGAPAPAAAQINIAILGDSAASGEGNPDVDAVRCGPGPGPRGAQRTCARFPTWRGRNGRAATPVDAVCHRGTSSGALRAAEQLGTDLSGVEPVTVETFACSGATTMTVGRSATVAFSAYEPFGTVTVPSQLSALAADPAFLNPATGNRIDALIVFVGANDINFADIVGLCGSPVECYRVRDLTSQMSRLSARYGELRSAIASRLGSRVGNVFLVGYHNPSTGPDGPCGGTIAAERRGPRVRFPAITDLPYFWGMSWYESRYVNDTLVPELNRQVARGAAENGWNFVDGVAAAFQRHGHCASADQRWVRNFDDSLGVEGGHWGVVHPNRLGHDAIRDIVRQALQPYMERLAAPASPSFEVSDRGATVLRWSGGAGARRQIALFDLTAAARAVPPVTPPQAPPGFAGDGARQRVLPLGGPPTQISHIDGTLWQLAEIDRSNGFRVDPDAHFLAAVRSCNALRCSGWSAMQTTPPSAPAGVAIVRGATGGMLQAWRGHNRNRAYQVAIPNGPRRWTVLDVRGAGAGMQGTETTSPRRTWSEEAQPGPGPDRRVDDGRVMALPANADFAAQIAQFSVRACNETGCSPWVPAAEYINPLATPVPGSFSAESTPIRCTTNGTVRCGTGDAGRRTVLWPRVAGADVYQVASYRRTGEIEVTQSTDPAKTIDQDDHSGLRVRACNFAGCSDWSAVARLVPGPMALPAPANVDPPVDRVGTARASAPPPSRLPPPGF